MTTSPLGPKPRHRWFAAVYDMMAKMDEKKARPIRQLIAGGAGGRVLEIGCGTGSNLEHYDWSRVDRLDATEPDVHMLRRAEDKAADLSTDIQGRVHLQEVPAEALPFDDASFDAAVATLVLCTVSDLGRSLAEVHRVLRPGGELRLFEHVRGDGLTRKVQDFIQPVYGWMAAGCQLSRDTESAVRSAGFDLESRNARCSVRSGPPSSVLRASAKWVLVCRTSGQQQNKFGSSTC